MRDSGHDLRLVVLLYDGPVFAMLRSFGRDQLREKARLDLGGHGILVALQAGVVVADLVDGGVACSTEAV